MPIQFVALPVAAGVEYVNVIVEPFGTAAAEAVSVELRVADGDGLAGADAEGPAASAGLASPSPSTATDSAAADSAPVAGRIHGWFRSLSM